MSDVIHAASVDCNHLRRKEAGLRRGEKSHGVRDVFGNARAPDHGCVTHALQQGFVFGLRAALPDQVGEDEARRDRVHSDAVRPEFHREPPRQRDHGCFRGRIEGVAGQGGAVTRDGAEIDDAAIFPGAHFFGGEARDVDQSVDIGAAHARHPLGIESLESGPVGDAGVIDQDRNRAEEFGDIGDEAFGFTCVADIGAKRFRLSAGDTDLIGERIRIGHTRNVIDRNHGALTGQAGGNGASQSARSAGHKRCLTVEYSIHFGHQCISGARGIIGQTEAQFLKPAIFITAAFTLATAAHADFSYKVTRKTGGMMAAMANAGPQTSTYYFKDQKMKSDNGTSATILDFDAQTITTLNNATKSYTVRGFGEGGGAGSDIQTQVEVKETGEKKVINGFNASEVIMTMTVDSPQMGKMPMEVDIWVSPDVPGSNQAHEFYKRNAAKFPWSAMSAGGNPGMQKAMAELQRKLTSLDGVPVEEIVRMKSPAGAGAPAMPQMSSAQSAQLAQARAKLEALANGGGPAAAMAKQQLDRLPGGGAPAGGSGSGALIEITMDSSDFSSAPVDDAVFAIPPGYTKAAAAQ